MRPEPAAIVLAAGASRRMGCNKMLLELDGKPLVRHAVERALAARLSPVVVVLGHQAEQTRAALDDLPCIFTTNPGYTGPISGSLHCGLEALPEEIDAAVVMLADMPLVTAAMLEAVALALPAPLAVSRYGDVLAPPLLFRRELFAELLEWHGEGCGKQVVMQHQDEATYLDWPVEALADVDTLDDAERARLT